MDGDTHEAARTVERPLSEPIAADEPALAPAAGRNDPVGALENDRLGPVEGANEGLTADGARETLREQVRALAAIAPHGDLPLVGANDGDRGIEVGIEASTDGATAADATAAVTAGTGRGPADGPAEVLVDPAIGALLAAGEQLTLVRSDWRALKRARAA